jgi:hypothetical protein
VTVMVGYLISLMGPSVPPERLEDTTVKWTVA